MLRDAAAALLVFASLLCVYLPLRQANLTYDGASFLTLYSQAGSPGHAFHLYFGRVFHALLSIGDAAGIERSLAGSLQAALFMAAASAVFYCFLRRCGIPLAVSALFAFLLGFNATAVENATSVELYAITQLTVVLSLWTAKAELERPSIVGAALLTAACLAVLVLHVGFVLWVAAIYLVLAFDGKFEMRRAAIRSGQAVAVLSIFFLLLKFDRQFQSRTFEHSLQFFLQFWRKQTGLEIIATVVNAPLYDFAAYAGLVLFPATLGLATAPPQFRPLVSLLLAATILFFGLYSFWEVDLGSFYMPLFPIWGLFAALGVRWVARLPVARLRWAALAIAAFYFLVFVWNNQPASAATRFEIERVHGLPLSILFWAVMLLPLVFRKRLIAISVEAAPPARWLMACWAVLAIAFSVAAFWRVPVQLLRPDHTTVVLDAFQKVAPKDSRLITSIEGNRPFAQTGAETIYFEWPRMGYTIEETARIREVFIEWLSETKPPVSRALFFDRRAYVHRNRLWKEAKIKAINLDDLAFSPVQSGNYVFYSVELKPNGNE